MTLQTTVAAKQGFGVPGENFLEGPLKAQPGIIDSTGVTNPNRVGRAFTGVAGSDGHCTVGATGVFYGWLANPKVYPNRGSATDTLAPSLDLPRYAEAEFIYSATGLEVVLAGAGNIGDAIDFDTTTGIPEARPKSGSATGSVTSNVLTVTAADSGGALIGVGSIVTTSAGVATVESLGTGTGGTGTYNLSTTPNAGSGAVTFNTVPASGKQRAPGWEVVRYNIPSAGLGVIGTTQ